MQALFRRWPALCGFSVEELRTLPGAREVIFRDVAVRSGCRPPEELVDDLATTLLELADECPEAEALLAGHTFAPTIH